MKNNVTDGWISRWPIRPSVWNLEIFHKNPGRTFLGKRRYFSGIAALTPLTPLTYKQNAVNAFIPTKKTPLAFRLNAVNAVIPEKTCVYEKSDFLPP